MSIQKRILSSKGNLPVRRNLFGPVDPEQLQAEYQVALRKDLEEASQRWSFDFISDKPLESGDYQWEGVPCTKVPLLYRSCMLGQVRAHRVTEAVAAAASTSAGGRVKQAYNEKENIPCSPKRCENLEKTPERRESRGLKRKQTNITGQYISDIQANNI